MDPVTVVQDEIQVRVLQEETGGPILSNDMKGEKKVILQRNSYNLKISKHQMMRLRCDQLLRALKLSCG